MGTQAHGSNFNLIEYAATAYKKPIMITEWNANHETSDDAKVVFTSTWLQDVYENRARYNIESVMIYQMDGGPDQFGLFYFPKQTATVKAFTASHLTL
jgi:hypothetical protein